MSCSTAPHKHSLSAQPELLPGIWLPCETSLRRTAACFTQRGMSGMHLAGQEQEPAACTWDTKQHARSRMARDTHVILLLLILLLLLLLLLLLSRGAAATATAAAACDASTLRLSAQRHRP